MRMAPIRSEDPRNFGETEEGSVFRCLHCKASLKVNQAGDAVRCTFCGAGFENREGIPILVRDRRSIETTIQETKKSGRRDWYEAPQANQWQGRYRHHLAERRLYLERTI
jgi:uncharacterized protein YbaR (Trm112 family)